MKKVENMDYKSVDEYISIFPPEVQKILEEIRQIIRKTVPGATEMIAYRMPAYKLNGKPLAYFAAFKEHIGFYPLPHVIDQFKTELSKYKQGKGSVQFPIDQAMPLDLIERIVKLRALEVTKGINNSQCKL